MRNNRFSVAFYGVGFAIVFLAQSVYATYARVESMGKKATFFMDDISIFDNPANMNIFPNFLIGELGTYLPSESDLSTTSIAGTRYNRDPENSWFGGIFSYSLSKNKESGNLYPQISIGGAFNRRDEQLLSLIPKKASGKSDTLYAIPQPVTNFDGFLGFTMANGGMLGSHIYIALQEGADLKNGILSEDSISISDDINVYVFRGDLGVNWPIARNIDGEVSVGIASVDYGPKSIDPEISLMLKARAFSTLELINGELVPMFELNNLKVPGIELSQFRLGCGVNVSLDRGFFWLGVQGILDEVSEKGIQKVGKVFNYMQTQEAVWNRTETRRGGQISFGIERNIWWDWFVLRVGGSKQILYVNGNANRNPLSGKSATIDYNYTYTNPAANTTGDDHIGFGIGINIEEKLKIDATLAEDVPYTFGNLFFRSHSPFSF